MIENEVNNRIQDLVGRLQQQGMDVASYLEATGNTAESLAAEFREPARQAVKVDLALRSVAEFEGLIPDDDKVAEQIAEMAGQTGQDPDELMTRLSEVGQLSSLRADLSKQAAMEWLTENVELVDENGGPVPSALLELPVDDADAHPDLSADSADSNNSADSGDSADSLDSPDDSVSEEE